MADSNTIQLNTETFKALHPEIDNTEEQRIIQEELHLYITKNIKHSSCISGTKEIKKLKI